MKPEFRAARGICALVLLGLIAGSQTARAQAGTQMSRLGQLTSGKLDFQQYCAQCHGKEGIGNGPVAAALKKKPANLTLLSRENGGVFPDEVVRDFIDGSKMAEGHGTREMPIWGYAFMYRRSSRTGPGGAPMTQAEVDSKIARLADYIKSIQAP